MIDRDHALPITRQSELLGIGRGQVYYLPKATSECDQRLMRRIDALHLERRSRAAGCCATCSPARACRWAADTSPR